MGFFGSLAGFVRLELISADKETALRDISNAGIAIKDAESIDELRVQFTISRASMGKVQELTQRKGERLTVLRRSGLFWPLWSLHRRPVLMAAMALMLALTIVVTGPIILAYPFVQKSFVQGITIGSVKG